MTKKNPQDATLRNIRAASKKISKLLANVTALVATQAEHDKRIRCMEVLILEGAAEEVAAARRPRRRG